MQDEWWWECHVNSTGTSQRGSDRVSCAGSGLTRGKTRGSSRASKRRRFKRLYMALFISFSNLFHFFLIFWFLERDVLSLSLAHATVGSPVPPWTPPPPPYSGRILAKKRTLIDRSVPPGFESNNCFARITIKSHESEILDSEEKKNFLFPSFFSFKTLPLFFVLFVSMLRLRVWEKMEVAGFCICVCCLFRGLFSGV